MKITYLEEEKSYDYPIEGIDTPWDDVEIYKLPRIYIYEMADYQLLKIKRVAEGFNQTELSCILDMGVSTLSEIETGRREIPNHHAEKIESYIYDDVYENKQLKEY